MLHEYREEISKLKQENAHFAKIFEKHNELDDQIQEAEDGRSHVEHFDLEKMKKEKLRLKDEAYTMIMEFKDKQ